MNKYLIEICANSVLSGIRAQEGGAGRIELCAGIPEGGTTPSYGEIAVAREKLSIRLHVIIRPRSGDFLYSPLEIDTMVRDIEMCRRLGVDGVVFGCLTPYGKIDMDVCRYLAAAAGGMSLTFHRAFDVCDRPFEALEQIIELGFDRILTSGQEMSAWQGASLIAELVKRAAGRIIIMPGCGVNERNIVRLRDVTGACEFHMSARETVASPMIYRNERVSMGGEVRISEFSNDITSSARVRDSLAALSEV